MAQLLSQEGSLFHTLLIQKFQKNEQRSIEIKNFSCSIVELFNGFTSQITLSCRKFFKKLKIDEEQDESIIFLSKFIIDILNELSKKINVMNKKIENQVIEPLAIYIQNQSKNHISTLRLSQEMLYSIQANNQFLKELNRNFEANESCHNKSMEQKQLLKQIFESQIDKCNEKWQQIKNQYSNILQQIDSFNSARCNFTVKSQVAIVRLINRLVNSSSVEEALVQYEQIWCGNENMSISIKQEMRDKLGKLIIFEELGETDIYNLVASEIDEKQKLLIDDFISFFTSRSNLKEQYKNFEEPRTFILQNMKWTNYFLTKLKSSLHTEIKLSNVKFRQLATIIKYIFALIVELQSNEGILYNLLYISYKVRYKDQYLIKELGKHEDFWKNNKLWQGIIQYIKNLRIKSSRNTEQKMKNVNNIRLMKIFRWDQWLKIKISTQKKIKSEKFIQDAKVYEILCQINYYMAKFQLEEEFIFKFLLFQSQKYGISKENTKKLLEYHYMNKMNLTNKLSPNYIKRKLRLQQKYKLTQKNQQNYCICVGKAIKYLPLNNELMNFLLVSKSWNLRLKSKILRRYLIHEKNYNFIEKNRLRIYRFVCQPPFSRQVYKRMCAQVPDFTQHLQIIQMDARRSLSWDENLRGPLIQILKTFSYYHPDVGYLQGMNYLCQNILKLTDDTFIVYTIFEHLMNNQYYGIYTGNFDGLKLKIYQFMRLLQRERPELFQHLRAEKIQGQHFLLSWAITLWGEMSGDLCWILWDGFIFKGWNWWLKTSLWLLKVLEPQIIKMSFEEIMKCFSDLHSSLLCYSLKELSQYGIDKNTIKDEINAIRIEKQVLIEIQKQYKLKASTINEYLKKIFNSKKRTDLNKY